jgi:hypothetical protein
VILLCQKKKNAIPSTAYARSRKSPSSPFDSASLITDVATATESTILANQNESDKKLREAHHLDGLLGYRNENLGYYAYRHPHTTRIVGACFDDQCGATVTSGSAVSARNAEVCVPSDFQNRKRSET